jgi:hypothetical protein
MLTLGELKAGEHARLRGYAMLVADYIAISVLIVSVERLLRGNRFISPNPPTAVGPWP